MNEHNIEKIFNALSDANRIKILQIINSTKEVCGCDILEKLSITQPTLAYHMKILQEAKLVTCYKKGTWCVYNIEKEEFEKISRFIQELTEGENKL